jgi:hypothetical protein
MIKAYNYNVCDVLKNLGQPRGEVFLGVELEVEVDKKFKNTDTEARAVTDVNYAEALLEDLEDCGCEDCAKEIARRKGAEAPKKPTGPQTYKELITLTEEELEGFAILKHDGTIEFGFEIVTCPASLLVQKARWRKFLTEGNAKGYLSSAPNCGMHIHMSKAPLTLEMRGNMHVFVNSPTNQKFIEEIAGRKANTYTTFIPKPKTEVENPTNKYEALNLLPKHTVELRIFASTTNLQVINKNLEFAAALAHWVGTDKILDPLKKDFLGFVDSHRKRYSNLVSFLESLKEL